MIVHLSEADLQQLVADALAQRTGAPVSVEDVDIYADDEYGAGLHAEVTLPLVVLRPDPAT